MKWYHQKVLLKSFPMMSAGYDNFWGNFCVPLSLTEATIKDLLPVHVSWCSFENVHRIAFENVFDSFGELNSIRSKNL
jgi:hypothetical protein